MMNLTTFVPAEFKKPLLDSGLQLGCLAIIIYGFSFFVAPNMACGSGNTHASIKAFQCASGQMLITHKLLIISGIAVASLLAGRAVSLMSNHSNSKTQP